MVRSRGRGPGEVSDRRRRNDWHRRLRRSFFSEAFEGDDDGVGIAEKAVDVCRGKESGDGVEVAELCEVGHG